MKELVTKIKEARVKAVLTQKDLAEKSGVMQCTISRFESGKQSITLDTMIKLARSIGSKELTDDLLFIINEQLTRMNWPKQL